ncbi:Iron-sulfur cluster assembly protein SufD [Rhodovulum sp. P5]|uniref:Fe-S cluster assembly protein SufD n=1 Tax=Rhodovulum sp. P5 TaxID=1564506 RepID=UPI0009C1EA80|nr:Fe-S cluster assembly protein SufD [Rhodovulum sp. P5]ARE41690.1 Iron-sulfur cluster assembly protein SufD [Rhodovulum sp. P5]
MGLPQAKQTATEARLEVLSRPENAGWTSLPRSAAQARVMAMGLPARRDEYWRFTNPADLIAPSPIPARVAPPVETMTFDTMDRVKLVFVDGVFDAEASDDPELAGVEISRLADAQTQDIHWASALYGTLEAQSHEHVHRPLAALNTAFATDGVLIRATGRAEKPVNLIYLHKSEASDAILHHCIRVEEGADLTVLENGPAAARFNKVMEIDIADGGAFHHVRTQGRDHERRAATHVFARLGKESTFKSFTMTMNGALTRNECVIEFTGDNGVAHVAGACMGDGTFLHDDTVFITHDAEHCESRQVFKKVLKNGATGVFQGKILVQPGAQKTDGYQISQSLLLDDDSQFLAKPELEIYADDVACSHGSTSGAIDETALFYLRSRGVPKSEAQDLMVLSFLAEAIEEIESEEIREEIVGRLAAWLGRHRG